MPFPNKSFDKVVMSEVIEHVDNEKAVIKSISGVEKRRYTFDNNL